MKKVKGTIDRPVSLVRGQAKTLNTVLLFLGIQLIIMLNRDSANCM